MEGRDVREFEWLLNDEVVATGSVADDSSVSVVVNGMEPVGFISVAAMQERFAALPGEFELRWVG